MPNRKIVDVVCKCGADVARYLKIGKGRLQKMYLSRVLEDYTQQLSKKPVDGTEINCLSCGRKIATVMIIHGKPAAKVNHATVKDIRI